MTLATFTRKETETVRHVWGEAEHLLERSGSWGRSSSARLSASVPKPHALPASNPYLKGREIMSYPSKAALTVRDVLTLAKCACNAALQAACIAAFFAMMILGLAFA